MKPSISIKSNISTVNKYHYSKYKISSQPSRDERRRNQDYSRSYPIITIKFGEEVKSLFSDINSFKNLEYNWDSYGAESISKQSINTAVSLIESLYWENIIINFATPMRDGGIQLEKQFSAHDCEIEIHPDGEIILLIFDKEANFKEELKFNIENIEKLANKLKSIE